jgi:hypothetical protein
VSLEVPMSHVLAVINHAKTSYWPAAVIGFGIAASLAWTAFLGYAAVGLVKGFLL